MTENSSNDSSAGDRRAVTPRCPARLQNSSLTAAVRSHVLLNPLNSKDKKVKLQATEQVLPPCFLFLTASDRF